MARNGSGTYSLPAGNPVVTNTTISSTWANNTLSDIATALTNSIAKDGQTTATANLPMGGFKLTNIAAGTTSTDSARFDQIFNQGAPTDIASASTVDIGSQLTNFLTVTGTTTITSFGTNYKGPKMLRFTGAVLLTHDATTLIIPGAANLTTAAGDTCIVVPKSTTSGTADGWQIITYQKASGLPAESGANTSITSLGNANSLLINSATTSKPAVRQTVLSGPVDSSGFSAFGGSTGGTTVTATGTLIATAANGYALGGGVDYTGSITNPAWTGLNSNGTMYLYLDIAANGTCTTGSTTVAPVYQWGGSYSTTNNQFTFNIQEMVGKVGNSTVATQTYRVFVGEVTVSGNVVTAITWYALMKRYQSQSSSTPSNTRLSVNHNIGFKPQISDVCVSLVCTTTDVGYAVGDEIPIEYLVNVSSNPIAIISADKSTVGVVTTSAYTSPYLIHKTTGVTTLMTLANWQTRFYVKAGW